MNLAAIAPTTARSTPAAAEPLTELNAPGNTIGTVKRVPFAKTLELQYGQVLGEFDQLYDATQAALKLSEGAKPAVVISTFQQLPADFVQHKPFVLYDVDYALKSRPLNPMTHPEVLERGDFHHGQVATFGYESKSQSWENGAPQYVVDDGHSFNIQNLEERT